eukprot:snap_masked-scaffold_2-processed-gene-14.20-mRNA-1 protein AED:1.00 eAED:1.00 QI:0/-1/0/0/-1/1/1/0/87
MTISTQFKNLTDTRHLFELDHESLAEQNQVALICRGEYELWWVQYVRVNRRRVVEHKKSFRVVWPPCSWNGDIGTYLEYVIVDNPKT